MPEWLELFLIPAAYVALVYSLVVLYLGRRKRQQATATRVPLLEPAIRRDSKSSHSGNTLPLLSPRQWLPLLNDRPDQIPHVLIAGKSGSGKTTLARALLQGRGGEIVIFNPKDDPDDWDTLPYLTVDRDGTFTTIAAALDALYTELMQRVTGAPPLTVVLDDVSSIAQDKESKDAYRRFLRATARTGRSKRLRLVVLAHETTAQAIGLPGEVALLDNFSRIDIQRGTHQATMVYTDDEYVLDTRQVQALALRPIKLKPFNLDTAVSVSDRGDDLPDTAVSVPPVFSRTEAVSAENERDEAILLMLASGWSFSKIHRVLGGNRNDLHARVKNLRELSEVEL